MNGTIICSTTPDQTESNDNKRIFHTSLSSKTGASPSSWGGGGVTTMPRMQSCL